MCMVPFRTFLQFIKKGSFNTENLPADGYSHTMAILLAFVPDPHLADIECVGIGNVIWRHGSPLGDIASVHVVIDHIRTVLASEHKKDSSRHRVYMMLIGNYGGHMAFAMDPPYCVAYAADYKNTTILPKWHPVNPKTMPSPMTARNMVVRRLLSVPNWELAERKLNCRGLPSHSEGHAFWSQVVSRLSHTMQPHGSLDWFNHLAGDSISDGWTLPSHRSNFSQSPRGSGIVYCQKSGQVEGVRGFKPYQFAWVPATLPSACILQSG